MGKFNYFLKKNEMEKRAVQWTNYMDYNYKKDIENSISNSLIYEESFDTTIEPRYDDTNIVFLKKDTVSAIFDVSNTDNGKICALNFASYKNPGGMFIKGSTAQEECLCHESFLYNVLKRFENKYYKVNKQKLNKSLYTNKLLYSKFILFFKNKQIVPCDIITCAAPNKTAAVKYHDIDEETIINSMVSRIHHVLLAAYDQKVDTLILGAYGCGVFGHDPKDVSQIMYILLNSTFRGCFKKVVFAIPKLNNRDNTYDVFYDVYNKYNVE